MKKIIISRTLELSFLLLIYFGAYLKNNAAEILMLLIFWLSTLCVLLTVAAFYLANPDNRAIMASKMSKKTNMSKLYSYAYDAFVCCLLFYLGYEVIATIWLLTQWTAVIYTSNLTKTTQPI